MASPRLSPSDSEDLIGSSGAETEDPVASSFEQTRFNWCGLLWALFPGSLLVIFRAIVTALGFAAFTPVILISAKLGLTRLSVFCIRLGARIWLWCLGYHWIKTSGKQPRIPEEGCVITANHLGGVDILWMVYEYGPAFVSNSGVKDLPLLGAISLVLDCVFVDRMSAGGGASKAIIEYFAADAPRNRRLCVFPEGMSTNGTALLPFKRGAFLPPVVVYPHAMTLPFCDGYQFDPHFSLVEHLPYLLGLMSQVCNCMHVEYLPPNEYVGGVSPGERAEVVRGVIADALGIPMKELTYQDKVDYMAADDGEDEDVDVSARG